MKGGPGGLGPWTRAGVLVLALALLLSWQGSPLRAESIENGTGETSTDNSTLSPPVSPSDDEAEVPDTLDEPTAKKAEDNRNLPQVRRIEFEGLKLLDADDIKKILTTREQRFRWFSKAPLDDEVLKDDLDRIGRYIVSQGFYHGQVVSHEVVPISDHVVKIVIRIEEGPPMMVSALDLTVDGQSTGYFATEVRKVLPLVPGVRFTTPAYRETERTALRYFADRGQPKAKIDMKARLDKATNEAQVTIALDSGPICFFGDLTVEGNTGVATKVISREVAWKAGRRFNASLVQETQRRLFDLRLFQFVDISVEGMEGSETTLPVRITVREGKKQTVRAGVGYGTEDKFRGQVQYEVRNFVGDGRRLQVSAKASSLVQELNVDFLQPYAPGPRSTITMQTSVGHENEVGYENNRFRISPRYNYKLTSEVFVYGGPQVEMNRLTNVTVLPQFREPEDREDENFFISALRGGLTWDHVDDLLNPTRGVRFLQDIEWASSGLGSAVDYVKLTIEGRGYLPLAAYGVLAARLRWGGITEIENTSSIPIFKRFFAGGGNSVRGYPYEKLGPLDAHGNPIGGLTVVEGNLDWRFPIKKPLEGVLFFDLGNVYPGSYDIVWTDLRYTTGAGVRYMTPVGPVRLDVGWQLNPPEGVTFDRYQIYFSVGQAF